MIYNNETDVEKIKHNSKIKSVLIYILTITTIVSTVLLMYLGVSVYKTTQKLDSLVNLERLEITDNKELNETFNKLVQIDKYYKMFYVGEIDYDNLELVLGNALITAYGDKYGAYFDEEYTKKQIEKNTSSLYGIGILVRAEEDKHLYVIESYEGPAKEAGIETGCIITKVDGKELDLSTNELYNEVIDTIKGEINTTVEITFIDNEGIEHTVDVKRAEITITSVVYEIINNDTGYVLIREFGGNTDEDFEKALRELKSKGINKVIYDVRGNSGGLLTSVSKMLDLVLPAGETIYIVNANEEVVETHESDRNMIEFEKSIVLVDKNSASASELFAQSLKEFGIATIIGETTFGKGTVCSEYMLSDTDMIMISTYKYLTKSKECLEGIGVKPDIEFVLSEEESDILYKLPLEEDDVIAKALDILY